LRRHISFRARFSALLGKINSRAKNSEAVADGVKEVGIYDHRTKIKMARVLRISASSCNAFVVTVCVVIVI